jgi:hypothetical protein
VRHSELLIFLFGDVAGGFIMGGPRAGFINLSDARRFVFFSFSAIGMEIRSFPWWVLCPVRRRSRRLAWAVVPVFLRRIWRR